MKALLARFGGGAAPEPGRGGLSQVSRADAPVEEAGYWDDDAAAARELSRLARAQVRRLRAIRRARHGGLPTPPIDGTIAAERLDDWTTQPERVDRIESRDLRECERWYRAAADALLEVAEWLEMHPKTPLGEHLTPEALHVRLQCVATAQKGIYCWLDEHVAATHDAAWRSCGVQLRIYQQLANVWTKNFRTKLDAMRREERVTSDARVAVERILDRLELESAPSDQPQDCARATESARNPTPTDPDAPAYDSVLESFEAARAEFAGPHLVFTERALESAERSAFRRPGEVFAFLRALSETAQLLANGVHEDPFHLLKQRGFPSKPSNGLTMSRHRRFYFMPFEGREVSLSMHVTLGSRNQNTCMSIHWWHDSEGRRFVIGHCGKHLPNTRT